MNGSEFGGAIVTLLLLGLYFLPAIIASRRRHHQEGAITILNLLLGWTFIGWVIALIWAATATNNPAHPAGSPTNAVPPRKVVRPEDAQKLLATAPPPFPMPRSKTCPRCAEDVKAAAQVCRFCGHEFS